MISFELRKKQPPIRIQDIREAIRKRANPPPTMAASLNAAAEAEEEEVRRYLHTQENQQRIAEGQPPVPWLPGGSGVTAVGMGKHGYAQWLNNMVYNRFHKGQMVTLRNEPLVLGMPPKAWFVIHDIQEIHYMADMDRDLREPKALHVKSGKYDISMWYAPGKLRVLHHEEIEAIDRIRNKAPNVIVDADRPDVGAGTPPVSVSPEGERSPAEGEGRTEEGDI